MGRLGYQWEEWRTGRALQFRGASVLLGTTWQALVYTLICPHGWSLAPFPETHPRVGRQNTSAGMLSPLVPLGSAQRQVGVSAPRAGPLGSGEQDEGPSYSQQGFPQPRTSWLRDRSRASPRREVKLWGCCLASVCPTQGRQNSQKALLWSPSCAQNPCPPRNTQDCSVGGGAGDGCVTAGVRRPAALSPVGLPG